MSEIKDNVKDLPWMNSIRELAEEFGEGLGKSECLIRIAAIAKRHNIERGLAKTVFNEEIKKYKARSGEETQDDALLRLAGEAELFRTSEGIAYANVMVDGHRKTYAVKSTFMRQWLTARFLAETGKAPATNAMQAVLGALEAKACINGAEVPVYLRVGSANGKLYLDLADGTGQAVEIDANGWRVIAVPPVRFRRTKSMQPLPIPQSGGSVEDLKYFIHFATMADLILTIAWLVAGLRDRGPYPILNFGGEPGAAKTSAAKLIRGLIDPSSAPLRSIPKEERDLFITAKSNHVVALDNISTLPAWLSDGLCRLSTGGGLGTRTLYENDEETTFNAVRPIILGGIDDYVTRGDLADRVISIQLAQIDPTKRRTEEELFAAFEAARPKLLGALLDMVAHGIKMLPTIRLAKLPRMADFAVWAAACETKVFQAGITLGLYERKREEVDAVVVEGDPALRALQKLIAGRGIWTGMVEGLLKDLAAIAGTTALSKDWPPKPRSLSSRLRKAATSLRQLGIDVQFGRHTKTGTPVTITRLTDQICVTKTPFASLASPFASPENDAKPEGLRGSHEVGDASDANSLLLLRKKEKEKEENIKGYKEVGGICVTASPASPSVDKSSDRNGLAVDANGDANSSGDANPPVDGWRAYQQARVAHHLAHHPEDEARAFAWSDLVTRWCWAHRGGPSLAANGDQRDAATQELLVMGLAPSAGDIG
jgi:hypothetical protein